jgi:putative membrane protein
MKDDLTRFLKGFAMGAANVIPGVSGGTIAFDVATLRLVVKGNFREAAERIDLRFLGALAAGVGVSFLTLARVLKWGFKNHETVVWAFFFGLIAASLPAVGKMVRRWSAGPLVALLVGLAVALSMGFLNPAGQNEQFLYLVLCGVVAMCSMIIPGLSGSFVLLLMGNYKLVMVDSLTAVSDLQFGDALRVLLPVGIGAALGVLILARFLSWLFHNWHDVAVGMITGFVAGSLLVIWPWKDTVTETFMRDGRQKEKIAGFENWHLPDLAAGGTWVALGFAALGMVLILALERVSANHRQTPDR